MSYITCASVFIDSTAPAVMPEDPGDTSTITVRSIPSKHQRQPARRGMSLDSVENVVQYDRKRAQTVEPNFQPVAKRAKVPNLYPIAARVLRARNKPDEGNAEDEAEVPAKKTAAKPKPRKTQKVKKNAPVSEDLQENEEPQTNETAEQRMAADGALKEAFWKCSRMQSKLDKEIVTMEQAFANISSQEYQNLEEETVISAIASVWRGVIPHVQCSLHNYSSYRVAQKEKTMTTVQPPSDTLIIPLIVNTPTFKDGRKYNIFEQWVLVVASHEAHETDVYLDIFYNRPAQKGIPKIKRIDDLKDEQIRVAAQSIVRNSGWLTKTLTFDPKRETWHPICDSIGIKPNDKGYKNIDGVWSSAHLVVLMAWAFMLGIPLPSQMKAGVNQKDKLCPGIQRLIAMAFDGRLTPEAISIFIKLNFTTTQEPKIKGPRMAKLSQSQLNDVGAYMMNSPVLDWTLGALQRKPDSVLKAPRMKGGAGGGEQPRTTPIKPTTVQDVNPPRTYRNRDKAFWQTTYLNWTRAHAQQICTCIGQHQHHSSLWAAPETELDEEQVFGAIGALWYGRWRSRKSRRLGFGNMNAVQWLRKSGATDGQYRMVGGTARTSPRGVRLPLMIPMCGDATEGFAISHGHWVFVVARPPRREGEGLALYLWDSAPSPKRNDAVARQARWLVHQSGVLGREANGRPRLVHLRFEALEVKACPRQNVVDSCGIYVVLNAWCYQLGLTSPPERLFSVSAEQDRVFIQYAVLMINLALHGEADSYGIRAFLLATGYCHPKELKMRQRGDNIVCYEVGSGCNILNQYIDEIIDEEREEGE